MPSHAKPIPNGFHSLTPYLCVSDAARAIEFYGQAFGATLMMRLADPSGRVGHAELKVGDSVIMLADEHPEYGVRSPQAFGGSPVSLHLYVEDVDAVVARAVAAGAKVVHPVADKFYGDRSGRVEDPFGHVWDIGTHKEDVSPDEVERRYAAMTKS
jgi:PhnB protein